MHSRVGAAIGAAGHRGVASFGLAKPGLGEEGRGAMAMDSLVLELLELLCQQAQQGTVRLALGLDSFCSSEYEYLNLAIQHLLKF